MTKIIFLALTIIAGGMQGQFDYRPTSIHDAWSQTVVTDGTDYTIEPENYRFQVTAHYTGLHRELDQKRVELFRRWAKSLGHPPSYANICSHEVQVEDKGVKYWVALQDSLLDAFASEVGKDAAVSLQIIYVGAVEKERVFIVNGFQAIKT